MKVGQCSASHLTVFSLFSKDRLSVPSSAWSCNPDFIIIPRLLPLPALAISHESSCPAKKNSLSCHVPLCTVLFRKKTYVPCTCRHNGVHYTGYNNTLDTTTKWLSRYVVHFIGGSEWFGNTAAACVFVQMEQVIISLINYTCVCCCAAHRWFSSEWLGLRLS